MKTRHDVILPGHGLYWILGSLVAVVGLLALMGAYFANTADNPDAYAKPITPNVAITPNRQQEAVRRMADFMVKDENIIGLRMWARSLGISAPDFASAATLRENIRRNTDDFSIYRDGDELLKLVQLLGDNHEILKEIIR
jgi:hypothetical protein